MSGAPPELRIVYAYLETLRSNSRTAAEMLMECSELSRLDFSPNHEVTEAYEGYLDDWSRHRESLQKGLDSTADAFESVLETFQTVENELVMMLPPGSL